MTALIDVKSFEFYKMFVDNKFGKLSVYYGAIGFGENQNNGCEILRILSPMPSLQDLYRQLEKIHEKKIRTRLILQNWTRNQITDALTAFCQQGLPLPNLFEDGTARIEGLSVFQLSCYQQTSRIPHGETRPYHWLAERMKKFGAERAIGGAMRSNPFPLLIPCHRVVKKNGNLGGYLGNDSPDCWQTSLKKTLLDIESLHNQPSLFSIAPGRLLSIAG